MVELKEIYILDGYYTEHSPSPVFGDCLGYGKEEVDAVIANKDAEISDLKKQLHDRIAPIRENFIEACKTIDTISEMFAENERLKTENERLKNEPCNDGEKCNAYWKLYAENKRLDADNKKLTNHVIRETNVHTDIERTLRRALWIARAKRAIEKIAWFTLWNSSISTMDPEDGSRLEYGKWKKALGKFLKKAGEYK